MFHSGDPTGRDATDRANDGDPAIFVTAQFDTGNEILVAATVKVESWYYFVDPETILPSLWKKTSVDYISRAGDMPPTCLVNPDGANPGTGAGSADWRGSVKCCFEVDPRNYPTSFYENDLGTTTNEMELLFSPWTITA